jgi:hypothetical protein
VGHFDVAGADLDSLSAFYTEIFGWEVQPRGPGYAQLETPSLRGALVETPQPSLTLGVVVADLDAALAHVERCGGAVTMPAMDNGWVRKAQITDPAGNTLTLIQQ